MVRLRLLGGCMVIVLVMAGVIWGMVRYLASVEQQAADSPVAAEAADAAVPPANQLLQWNEGVLKDQDEAETVRHILETGELPPRFITKSEARQLGWVASEGNLWEVAQGKVIGGDRFFNREGRLPEVVGRQFVEADLNYQGGRRGPERLVFSTDLLIFVTRDHYETFAEVQTAP